MQLKLKLHDVDGFLLDETQFCHRFHCDFPVFNEDFTVEKCDDHRWRPLPAVQRAPHSACWGVTGTAACLGRPQGTMTSHDLNDNRWFGQTTEQNSGCRACGTISLWVSTARLWGCPSRRRCPAGVRVVPLGCSLARVVPYQALMTKLNHLHDNRLRWHDGRESN